MCACVHVHAQSVPPLVHNESYSCMACVLRLKSSVLCEVYYHVVCLVTKSNDLVLLDFVLSQTTTNLTEGKQCQALVRQGNVFAKR